MVCNGFGGMAVSKKKTLDEKLDEFRGQGGSYVADPVTGERTLVERTKTVEEAEAEAKEQDNGTA